MKHKFPEKKAIKLMLALAAAIFLIIAMIVIFQPGPKSVREEDGSYSVSSNMNLVDHLKNNLLLYPNNTTLNDPPYIYTNITSNLLVNLTLYYYNSIQNSSTINCTYRVFIISSDPSWSKETYTSLDTLNVTSGKSYNLVFGVNVTSNITLGKEIDGQLGYSSSGPYAIEISDITSSRIGLSYSNLTLDVGTTTDILTGPNNLPLNGVFSKVTTVPGLTIIPLELIYAYLMAVLGILVVTYLALTMEPSNKDYVKKFRRDHSGDLIELDASPPEGAIKVIENEDLMKMALLIESPVFVHDNIIFTELNGKSYYSEIKKKK
ncbi:MAG: hypothetical protein QXU18_12515 [Thermoplasmatales archaeon]